MALLGSKTGRDKDKHPQPNRDSKFNMFPAKPTLNTGGSSGIETGSTAPEMSTTTGITSTPPTFSTSTSANSICTNLAGKISLSTSNAANSSPMKRSFCLEISDGSSDSDREQQKVKEETEQKEEASTSTRKSLLDNNRQYDDDDDDDFTSTPPPLATSTQRTPKQPGMVQVLGDVYQGDGGDLLSGLIRQGDEGAANGSTIVKRKPFNIFSSQVELVAAMLRV